MRWAVLLAGGSGTRFWPLSTPENPKQLLPLAGSTSTAEESVERLTGLIPRERILVVTGAGAGRPPPAAARAAGGEHPGRAARRLHRSGAHLGHLRSPAPRSRGRGAVASRRLGGGRRGGLPPHRRHWRWHRAAARPPGDRRRGAVAARDRIRLHRARRAARRRRADGGPLLREAGRRHRARPDGGGRAVEQRALCLDGGAAAGGGEGTHAGGGAPPCRRCRAGTWAGSSAR